MAIVYVNNADSFEYNVQLKTKSIVEYTDGTLNDLSSIKEIGPQFEDEDEDADGEEQDDDPDAPVPDTPEPENPPDAPDVPDPEPPVPTQPEPQPPSPQPEPTPDNVIVLPQTCTAKEQKKNGDHPKRHVTTSSSGFCLSQWHTDLEKCLAYAKSKGVPMFYVWSNGANCSHCTKFDSAVSHSKFVNFMKANKLLWCYVTSSDKGCAQGSFSMHFTRGLGYKSFSGSSSLKNKFKKYRTKAIAQNTSFPFVGLYWYSPYLKKQIYDVVSMGDNVDGDKNGSGGATNVINWLNAKIKNFKSKGNYDVKTGTFTL